MLNELKAYLFLQLERHNLSKNIGPKTEQVLLDMLKKFTVSQSYNIIYYVVRNAASYSTKTGITKQRAVNTIPSRIETHISRAIAEGWEIKPYHRDHSLSQSSISFTLFNTLMGENDGGFTKSLDELFEM